MKVFVVLMLMSLVVSACGGSPTPTATVAPATAAPTDAPATAESASTDGGGSDSSDSTDGAPASLALAQTIESETGYSYQLPDGWFVNDNDRISNFASDEDAVLDYLSTDAEKNNRWIIIGSVSDVSADDVSGIAEAASFEAAAALMHEYYYTADADVQPPTIVQLANGKSASASVKNNPDMPGKAYATYFVDMGEGRYAKVSFESRADIMAQEVTFRDAVAASVTLR